jgi:hypothetical protein
MVNRKLSVGRLLRYSGIVGAVISSISAVNLLDAGFRIGWTEPFKLLLDQYVVISSTIRTLLEPSVVRALKLVADSLGIAISLSPHWIDIFLLMMIYLGSRVKAYAQEEKHPRAASMFLVSLIISLACSCFVSSVDLNGWSGVLVVTSSPLVGFLLYDLIYAATGSALDRQTRESWWHGFMRHLEFSVPLLGLCVAANLVLVFVLVDRMLLNAYQAFVLTFFLDYLIISMYWLRRGYSHASRRENRRLGEGVWERFRRSSATAVGAYVALVLLSASIFILGNAALRVT